MVSALARSYFDEGKLNPSTREELQALVQQAEQLALAMPVALPSTVDGFGRQPRSM
jgi:hypothetical protein